MSAAANATNTADDVVAWHAIPPHEVTERLATSAGKGLDPADAAARLLKYGPNRLPEGKKRGVFARFLAQFNNILIYVLLAAGFTKLMLDLWVDAAIIFGVVVLNALLGFIQEGKAEKALDSIRNMAPGAGRMKAATSSPHFSWARPSTATSPTLGWRNSISSSSRG